MQERMIQAAADIRKFDTVLIADGKAVPHPGRTAKNDTAVEFAVALEDIKAGQRGRVQPWIDQRPGKI